MLYSKPAKIILIGSSQELLLSLAKENEIEVVSSVSFLQNLIVRFVPDLIVFDSVKNADLKSVREIEKLFKVPILIASENFEEMNNLNSIVIYPRVLMCNKCVVCTQDFMVHLKKILDKKVNILPSKTGSVVKYAVLYMNKNLSSKITRTSISNQLGVNEDYLTRIFKNELGVGLWEYLNIFRLNEAKKMIEKTDFSAAKISSLCGFESASYFNNAFKKYFGSSPLSFRK